MHYITIGDSHRLEHFRDLVLGLSKFQVSVVSILEEGYLFTFWLLIRRRVQRLDDLIEMCFGQRFVLLGFFVVKVCCIIFLELGELCPCARLWRVTGGYPIWNGLAFLIKLLTFPARLVRRIVRLRWMTSIIPLSLVP